MKLTLWMLPEDPGVRVFGAGLVTAPAVESVTTWLRQVAPQRKLATAVHPNEGPTKIFRILPAIGVVMSAQMSRAETVAIQLHEALTVRYVAPGEVRHAR